MGFNYGLEKKRFEAEWTRLRKEYAEAGMEAWAIEEMPSSYTTKRLMAKNPDRNFWKGS